MSGLGDVWFVSVCALVSVTRSTCSLVLPCSMQCLREFSNFNSFLCILSAIESASVSRLDWSDKVNKVSGLRTVLCACGVISA